MLTNHPQFLAMESTRLLHVVLPHLYYCYICNYNKLWQPFNSWHTSSAESFTIKINYCRKLFLSPQLIVLQTYSTAENKKRNGIEIVVLLLNNFKGVWRNDVCTYFNLWHLNFTFSFLACDQVRDGKPTHYWLHNQYSSLLFITYCKNIGIMRAATRLVGVLKLWSNKRHISVL